MATLEELVVSLVAETSGLRAELDKASKATANATAKMDKAIEEFSNNSGKNVGFFQSSMATMTGFLASQAVLGAFNAVKDAAGFLFQELVVNGVAAAQATQDSITKMNQALALTGQYSKATSQSMIDLANSIESTTKFSDDSVLSAGALIQTIGKLKADALPGATKAAVELAAALSIDLDSAAKLVGKAATGNVDAFKRYGIVIEEGTTKSQTFANAMQVLGGLTGTAAAQARTFTGQQTIMAAGWEDLTKVIGNAIIKNLAVVNAMAEVNKLIGEGTEAADGNRNALQILIAEGLVIMINSITGLIAVLDVLNRAFHFLTGIVGALQAPLQLVIAAFLYLTDGADAAKDSLSSWTDTVVNKLSSFGVEGDSVLTTMGTGFAQLGIAAQEGLEQTRMGMEATIEPANKAKTAVEELTAAEVKRTEQLKSFAEGLAEQSVAVGAEQAYQQELLVLALENKTITEEEYHAARMQVLDMQQAEELALLEKYHQMKGSNNATYAAAKTALQKKQALEDIKFQNDRKKYEELTDKQRLDNLKSTLGTMATLSQSGNRTLAAIGKAAAITNATIDGYAAVQKALASAPPPINFALAAAVGVATAMNVAKIAGVGLNKGGTVPGTGPNRDSVPAMLTPGEEVINRDTANQLRSFLNGEGGAGSMKIEISLKDDLVEFIEAKIIERQRTGISLIQGAV